MNAVMGKILIVNLTDGSHETHSVPEEVYRNHLAGAGLAASILHREIPAGADPLGPDNVLALVSGLLTGTGSVVTGRWMAACKSPLTGGWGDANCGGTFAPAIKQCGYDGIFFKGISPKPVYLYADGKTVEIRDAGEFWGMDAVTAETELEKAHAGKKKPSVIVIGPAGEKLSLISGICNDRGRVAARSGVGAVMGSKKLKGVVLAGSKRIAVHDPAAMKAISKEYSRKIRGVSVPGIVRGSLLALGGKLMGKLKTVRPLDGIMVMALMKRWGTSMTNTLGVTSGDSPVKNWSGSVEDFGKSYYRNFNPDLIAKREEKKYHCYSCVIGCGGITSAKKNRWGSFTETHKPEYETCCAFGALVMNRDLDAVFYLNEYLNRAGMDTISAGGAVAFAIECFENGLLTTEDTGGLKLTWGNTAAIVKLVEMMVNREGLGDILADGVKAASRKIKKNSPDYAIHAGGQEPGMHDGRYDPMMGVHFSVDPTPGRHTIGAAAYYNTLALWQDVTWAPKVSSYPKSEEYVPSENEAMKSVASACFKQVVDGSGGCLFAMLSGIANWKIFSWLNTATGWDMSPDEYMEIGRRNQTLRQLFNIREGIDPISYRMHERMSTALAAGPTAGRSLDIEAMMKLHWKFMGWDEETGIPTKEIIGKLGLDNKFMELAK